MKNKYTRYVMLAAAVLLVLVLNSVSTYAAENVPDLDRTGSIRIALTDKKNQKAVTGGEITLYQVAKAEAKDGSCSYRYVNGFEDCDISLENLEDSELAEKLEQKVTDTGDAIKGVAQSIDAQGKTEYTDLSTGLYLLVQTKASDGYEKIESFLVSVPLKMDGEWVYDVDASPKVGTVTAVNPDTPKTPTSDTPKTPAGQTKPGGKLPQTGQLDWPVPVLCIAGLLLVSAGWMLRREEKDS